MTAPKIFFWVQHLLGIGHLKRTATLTRAFRRLGMEVTVVSGGQDVPGLDIADAKTPTPARENGAALGPRAPRRG